MKTLTLIFVAVLIAATASAQHPTFDEFVAQSQEYLPREFNDDATLTQVRTDDKCLKQTLILRNTDLIDQLYTTIRYNYTHPTKIEIPIMQMCVDAKRHLVFLLYSQDEKYLGSLFFSHQKMLDALTTTIKASKFIDTYISSQSNNWPINMGDGRILTKTIIYDKSNDIVNCFKVSKKFFRKLNENDIPNLISKDITHQLNDKKLGKTNETLWLQMALSGRDLYYLFSTDGTDDVKMGKLPSISIASKIGIDLKYDDGWTVKRILEVLDNGSADSYNPNEMITFKGVTGYDDDRNLVNIEFWINEGFENCPNVDNEIIASTVRDNFVSPENDCYRALAYIGAGLNIGLIGVKSNKKVSVIISHDELSLMCDY
ncbi:MAG: hypothetical protein J6Y72_12470 [Bacteroidales bacterium]|nr:hypothetical protein [Bacteroidales bacterium]